MADESKIEWTDSTFNPWMGCQKVSRGCDHCYAEALADRRYGWVQWGPRGVRRLTSDANWRKPVSWNRAATREGVRRRVFCASLADVMDNRAPGRGAGSPVRADTGDSAARLAAAYQAT